MFRQACRLFMLLALSGCAGKPLPAIVPSTVVATPPIALAEPPAVTARLMYEDFEGEQGLLPISPWPTLGGWLPGPFGHYPEGGLDKVVKASGDYGLRMVYRTGPMGQTVLSRLYAPALDWRGYDAVRFWLKPDGSGRRVVFFVLEKIREDKKKWFWEASYEMTGTDPVIVTMPFSLFKQGSGKVPPEHPHLDASFIYETAFWVRAARESATPGVFGRAAWNPSLSRPRDDGQGSGPINPEIPSTIWIDDVEVVKLRAPLYDVVAVPAPRRYGALVVRDGALRVDFGSEADWTDAEGQRWRADVSATQGVLFRAPDARLRGAAHPELHRTQRVGIERLRFEPPNGSYDLVLHFCELDPTVTGPGLRVFTVTAGGETLRELDPWAAAGGHARAFTRSLPVTVTSGELVVTFTPQTPGKASIVSALEIKPRP